MDKRPETVSAPSSAPTLAPRSERPIRALLLDMDRVLYYGSTLLSGARALLERIKQPETHARIDFDGLTTAINLVLKQNEQLVVTNLDASVDD